jgi:two-component system, OmpR family, sensor kinase
VPHPARQLRRPHPERLFDAQRRTLASASHELRSPLARLRLALELLGDDPHRPDRAELVADAVRDVEELDATVLDLLQVGRLLAVDRPEDPQPVDLRALAEDEATRVGATVSGAARVVLGDALLLRRLIRNLLENAARYGAPPLELRITDGGLEVLDRGPGVEAALQERIFEPFFRPAGHAEGRDGGVGLGLHLVREIARHHGGTVHVTPREGGGSRFVVELTSP